MIEIPREGLVACYTNTKLMDFKFDSSTFSNAWNFLSTFIYGGEDHELLYSCSSILVKGPFNMAKRNKIIASITIL